MKLANDWSLQRTTHVGTSVFRLWTQLIGLAPEQQRDTLRNATLTLRPMTEAERVAVTGKRLRIVAAHRGERLDDLGAHSGNAWSPAYTALANDLDVEAMLTEGQLVKIARVEPMPR